LAGSVTAVTGVERIVRWHTGRLVEYRFVPPKEGSAAISLVVSAGEVVFGAGKGARVELGPPGDCVEEVRALARGVAAGKLSETIGPRRVKFRLELVDGTAISGTSRFRHGNRPTSKERVDYRAYE
jgi:hypothetical protein